MNVSEMYQRWIKNKVPPVEKDKLKIYLSDLRWFREELVFLEKHPEFDFAVDDNLCANTTK